MAGILLAVAALSLPATDAFAQALQWSVKGGQGLGVLLSLPGSIAGPARRSAAVDASGNVVMTGRSGGSGQLSDFLTVKFAASTGAVLWQKTSNGPANATDAAVAVAIDGAGDVLVTGTVSTGPGDTIRTIKYAGADGALLWERSWAPPSGGASAVGIAIDATGNAVVIGSAYDAASTSWATIKFAAADGATLWEALLAVPAGSLDSVAIDGAGNVLVAGTRADGVSNTLKVIKYAAADGAVAWETGALGDFGFRNAAIALDAGGNALVTATSVGGSGNLDWRTLKLAATDAAILWDKPFTGDGTGDDIPVDIAVDAAGNAFVTGRSLTSSGPRADWRTIKYAASDGAVLWDASRTGSAYQLDTPVALRTDAAGNAIVTGILDDGFNADIVTIKYAAADGLALWEKTHAGAFGGNDAPAAVVIDTAGDALVAGSETKAAGSFLTVIKYASADGATAWTATPAATTIAGGLESTSPGGVQGSAPPKLARDPSGNLFLTGAPSPDFARILKIDGATGAALWDVPLDAVGTIGSRGIAIAVGPDGQPVVTGTATDASLTTMLSSKRASADGAALWNRGGFSVSQSNGPDSLAVGSDGSVAVAGSRGTPTGSENVTHKYAANGDLLWERVFTASGGAGIVDSAMDAAGNVVVVGNATGNTTGFKTVKYAAATGTTLWETPFALPGSSAGFFPAVVALDASGNAVVAGIIQTVSGYRLRTHKYAAADGALAWSYEHGTPLGLPGPVALAIDATGNVALTTAFPGSDGKADILVLKLAAASGSLLWGQTYDGPAHDADIPRALAIDASGNVIVTGRSSNGFFDEFRTLRFAGANGALLWQHTLNPDHYGEGLSLVTASGALFIAGSCVSGMAPQAICVARLQNRSTVRVTLTGPASSAPGTAVTFDATGTLADDPSASTAGTYTFRDGNTVLCTGTAKTCTTSSLTLGAHSITVRFEGNADSEATTSTPLSVNVSLLPQAISFTSTPPSPAGVGGPSYTVAATGGASGNPVVFSIDASSTPGACSIAPPVVSFTGAGTCKVNANQAGNASYDPAPQGQQSIDVVPAASLLQVAAAGASGGRITSSPAGIDCPGDCAETYPYSATVTLTASAQPGTLFTGWSGSCTGTGPCVLPMVAARGVTATFAPVSPATAVDIAISHRSAPVPPSAGKDLVVTWTATNASAVPASGVTLLHRSFINAAVIWASPGCIVGTGTVGCDMGAVGPGQSVQRVIVLRPAVPGTVAYDARVTAAEVDSNVQNNALPPIYAANASPAGVPVLRYRLYSPVTREHHFTTDLNEYDTLGSYAGTWVQEGTAGQVLDNPGSFNGVAATPYYRLYDTSNGQHLWTADPNEYYTLALFPQYSAEGVDGYIFPTQAPGTIPLYRLMYPYSVPVAGLHHWTIDPVEYDQLISVYGWVGEGVSGFVIP